MQRKKREKENINKQTIIKKEEIANRIFKPEPKLKTKNYKKANRDKKKQKSGPNYHFP